MNASEELIEFVRDALGRGLPRVRIEEALLQAGWDRDQVKAALAAFAEVEFPVPVPRPKPYLSAREAFMYLLLFTTLYITAFNLGSLLFELIERAFPDPAVDPAAGVGDGIRWPLASLIVAFPVFLYVARWASRTVRRDPTKRGSKIRKQLTYLTLFIGAVVLIGNFITLAYNFLGGELTTRFVLKVLTVALIAGTIFGYYLWDLRAEEEVAA